MESQACGETIIFAKSACTFNGSSIKRTIIIILTISDEFSTTD
jgi:hypothetical protein